MTAHHTRVSQKPMHSKPVDWEIYPDCAVAQYLKQSTVMCGCVSQLLCPQDHNLQAVPTVLYSQQLSCLC